MKNYSIDIGNTVLCDFCDKDYSDSDAIGGLLFESKAVCPECERKTRESIKNYNEEHFIRAEPKPGETFRDFVLRIRNGNNTISVSGEDEDIAWAETYFGNKFGKIR